MGTSTLKSTGGDYTTPEAWEADKQAVLSEPEILEIYRGTTVEGVWQADGRVQGYFNISSGWVTTAANRIILRGIDKHGGVSVDDGGSGCCVDRNDGAFSALRVNGAYHVTAEDIEFQNGPTSTDEVVTLTSTEDIVLKRLILKWEPPAPSTSYAVRTLTAYNDIRFENVSIISTGRCFSFEGTAGGGTQEFDNVNFYGVDRATNWGNKSAVARNCTAYGGNASGPWRQATGLTGTNNASGSGPDSTPPGTDPVAGTLDNTAGVDWVDAPNGNFTPQSGGKLDGAGADLSGTFTDDIAGNTRGDGGWEVGAYEIPAAAGGVTFDGPDIVAQTGTENIPFVFNKDPDASDVSARFTGATSYALSPDSDPLPAGLSVNSTTGNIEGTPTEVATRSIIIRGSE